MSHHQNADTWLQLDALLRDEELIPSICTIQLTASGDWRATLGDEYNSAMWSGRGLTPALAVDDALSKLPLC